MTCRAVSATASSCAAIIEAAGSPRLISLARLGPESTQIRRRRGGATSSASTCDILQPVSTSRPLTALSKSMEPVRHLEACLTFSLSL